MLRYIFDLLRNPDGYRGDWRDYAWNQIRHIPVVGAMPVYLGVPIWLLLLIFAAWEVWQWPCFEAEAWDCFEDWAFVACGALAFSCPVVLVPAAAFLFAGFFWRSG